MGYKSFSTESKVNKIWTATYRAEISKQAKKEQLNGMIKTNLDSLTSKAKELNFQARTTERDQSGSKQFQFIATTSAPVDSFEEITKAKAGIREIDTIFKRSMKELGVKQPFLPSCR